MYHIAFTFATADDGTVTASLYCKPGNGAIIPGTDKPFASKKFKLNLEVIKTGFAKGVFRYGKMSNQGNEPLEQRFGRLAIYDSIPKELPGIAIKFATGKIEKKK